MPILRVAIVTGLVGGVLLGPAAIDLSGQVPAETEPLPPDRRSPDARDPRPAQETVTPPRESAIGFGAEMAIVSAYIWRGFALSEAPSFQPSAWVSIGELTIASWMNLSREAQILTEHDLIADFSLTRGRVAVSTGWINYYYPEESFDLVSNEFYLQLGFVGLLNPTVGVFKDLHAGKGTYLNASVSQSVALPFEGVVLTPSISVAYNDHQFIRQSTFSDAVGGLALTLPLPPPSLSLAPFVRYSRSLNAEIFPSRWYWGVTLTVE